MSEKTKRDDDITEAARNVAVLRVRRKTIDMQIEAAFRRGTDAGATREEMEAMAKKARKEIKRRRKEQLRAKEQAEQIVRDMKCGLFDKAGK